MKIKKYNHLKKRLYNDNVEINLDDVINIIEKNYHIKISKLSIYNIVSSVASGKIISINQIKFMRKILEETPVENKNKIHSKLEALLDMMIKGFNNKLNKNLYVNAEISLKNFKNYRKILNAFDQKDALNFLRKSISDSIDVNIKDNNTAYMLNQKYHNLKINFKNDQTITNNDLIFMQKYSEMFDRPMLQTINNVMKLKDRFNYVNQAFLYYDDNIYLEIVKNYLERLEIYLINYPYCMKENDKIRHELNFIKNIFCYDIDKYDKLLDNSREQDRIKKNIKVVRDFIEVGNAMSVKEFCESKRISYSNLEQYSQYTNSQEIISLVKYRIEKQREKDKIRQEQEYETLRKYMVSINDDFSDFEVINYFSLTDKKVDYMLKVALNKNDRDFINKLLRFSSIYEDDLKKFSFKNYSLDSKIVNEIMVKINTEGYPRLVGIVRRALEYYNRLELENFTKENFIKQFDIKLEQKRR